MRRVGRPPLRDAARRLIAIRVDPEVLDRFRKEAKRRRVGYQTLINEVLAQYAEKCVHDTTPGTRPSLSYRNRLAPS